MPAPHLRALAREATVATVYRHACSDAAAAASEHDWSECVRLMQIARSIERAYPEVSARARFAVSEHPH